MKNLLAAVFLSFIVVASFSTSSFSEELTPQKEKKIIELLEITGSKAMGIQMMNAVTQSFAQSLKSSDSKIPDRAFDILAEESNLLMSKEIDNLMVDIVPLYHKHFSQKEIEQLVSFYKSPVGKKVTSVMPLLVNESMEIGQKWGESIAPKLVSALQSRFKTEGWN